MAVTLMTFHRTYISVGTGTSSNNPNMSFLLILLKSKVVINQTKVVINQTPNLVAKIKCKLFIPFGITVFLNGTTAEFIL
jgi:hypothetical protein